MKVIFRILLVFQFKVHCYIIINRKRKILLWLKCQIHALGVHLNKVMLYFYINFSINIPQFATLVASIDQAPQQFQHKLETHCPHQRSILLSQETK